jgi:hypothetical protein
MSDWLVQLLLVAMIVLLLGIGINWSVGLAVIPVVLFLEMTR